MRLPKLARNIYKHKTDIVSMGGVNYSRQLREGELRECVNLSSRRWPAITTRHSRTRLPGYSGVSGLAAWGALVAVEGTRLLYDGAEVGTVTAGEKQFAMVNTKLVIWPDKVYLDMEDMTLKPLGVRLQRKESGGVWVYDAQDSSIRCRSMTEELRAIKPGDVVHVTARYVIGYGYSDEKWFNSDMDVAVKSVEGEIIRFAGDLFPDMTEGERRDESGRLSTTVIERVIPDLDFICESENRLWGCRSADKTIYASALGDPTNFFIYAGVSTDSYAVAVGTDGPFTGCCKHGSSVLFWKEDRLHKVLGSYPAEYTLYTYTVEGLAPGCHKSLQTVNEVLYYMGRRGVYTYSGGAPGLISANFGEKRFTGAVAGSDGQRYYLSVEEPGGGDHLLVYDLRLGLWVREDDTRAVDFARLGSALYLLDRAGKVWLADSGEEDPEQEWLARFAPFYETVDGCKRYTKLLLRLELPRGSRLTADVSCDGGVWQSCGSAVGSGDGVTCLRLPVNRCDKFELRLRGKGPCTILSIQRRFSVGSDVG